MARKKKDKKDVPDYSACALDSQINGNYEVAINTKELRTSARRGEIARLILANWTKSDIIEYLMKNFNFSFKQAYSEYRQGYVFIFLNAEAEKEELRKLNLARLEELYDRAEKEIRDEKGNLKGKDFYST